MRREMLSVLTIGLVLTFAGSGTLAMFSDSETSTGNTFTAGNHELKLSDQDEDWRDGVTATWVMEDMKPGDSTWGKIGFKVSGGGSDLNISCDYTIDEGVAIEPETNNGNSADDMAEEMVITQMHYYGRGNLDLLSTDNYDGDYNPNPHNPGPEVEDVDDDGKITLYDLHAHNIDVRAPTPDRTIWLNMTLKFDEEAVNDFQGDMLNLTMIFTLH